MPATGTVNRSLPMEIAIGGAGFSGTLVAAHLLRKAAGPLTVRLIERAPHQFGRGVAYSTVRDCHFLNVPAAKMSAFPDDAEHFLRWARAREHRLINPPWVTAITAASFLSRRAYGDYLCGVLDLSPSAGHPPACGWNARPARR